MAAHVRAGGGRDSGRLGTKTIVKNTGEWLRQSDFDLVCKNCCLTKWRRNLI